MQIDCEQVAARIVEFLREKMAEGKYGGICLGLSGGVDSAVLATMATRVGNDPVDTHGSRPVGVLRPVGAQFLSPRQRLGEHRAANGCTLKGCNKVFSAGAEF